MNIQLSTGNPIILASVYPYLDAGATQLQLATSPAVHVFRDVHGADGNVLMMDGKPVTVEKTVTDAAKLILAVIAAEGLAGTPARRAVLIFLAEALLANANETN